VNHFGVTVASRWGRKIAGLSTGQVLDKEVRLLEDVRNQIGVVVVWGVL